jgi:hypothetical protein
MRIDWLRVVGWIVVMTFCVGALWLLLEVTNAALWGTP